MTDKELMREMTPQCRAGGDGRMIQKPEMIVMPAHPTNQWSRYGLPFDYFDRFGVNYDD